MERKLMKDLLEWINQKDRKPMILKGAGSTGKTWLVRELAARSQKVLAELNFEKHPQLTGIFSSHDPKQILDSISIWLGKKIDPENTLLFLDDVHACPEANGNLRWFYEEMPRLAVITAGSLLDFALEDWQGSMPVGRVTYRYLHPMSFVEFLWAMDEKMLADFMEKAVKTMEIPEVIHSELLEYYRQYCITGGMPEVVLEWKESRDWNACSRIQANILASYRNDFYKYRKNVPVETLRKTMESTVSQSGRKFEYSQMSLNSLKGSEVKKALELLEKAGAVIRVFHSSADGIFLAAGMNSRFFKTFLIDTGLALHLHGIQPFPASGLENVLWANNGALAQQSDAQLMQSKKDSW